MLIGLFLLLVLPILLAILLPLFLSLGIAKKVFGKYVNWNSLLPFIILVLGLTALVNIGWNQLVFNKLYYEWDRILFTPFTLILHESPLLDGSNTWIAQGWSITTLRLLFIGILIVVYILSFLVAYFWFIKTEKRNRQEVNSFTKVLSFAVGILLLFPLAWYQGLPLIARSVERLLIPSSVENLTACISPTEDNRIYYGGPQADYISSSDGNNIRKIWDKPGSSGLASGLISPDKSKLIYIDRDGLWIRCTVGDGQYKIPLERKKLANVPETSSLISRINWSPDSTYIAFNYGGDLVKLNTDTKEKIVIYPSVAFRDYGVDPTKPRPSAWVGPYYIAGDVYWGKDGSIYYSKFIDDNQVELRRLEVSGNDSLVLKSQYPLSVSDETKDGKIFIYESDWSVPNQQATHSDGFLLDPRNGQKERSFHGYEIYNNGTFYSFRESADGRYLILNSGYTVQLTPDPAVWVVDLSNNQRIAIQVKINKYLKDHSLTDSKERVSLLDISPNNDLLFYIYFDSNHPRLTLSSDVNGDNIKLIFKEDKNSENQPSWLMPRSWL